MDPQTINAMYSFNENEISEYTLSCFMLIMEFDEQKIILPFSLDLNILEQCGSCGISSGNLIAYTLSFDTQYLVYNDCNRFF